MKAQRKNVESDLLVDVFFSNLVSGRPGVTPEIGQNGHWFIDGKDTGVLARGVDGTDGTDGKTPVIGSNGNWWLDGRDLGVQARAPHISIGANGHWFIDGVDTAVPSNIESFLDKTTASPQTVAGNVTFNGALKVKGEVDIAKLKRLESGLPSESDSNGFLILRVSEQDPHYICVEPVANTRVKVIINKIPEPGDIYIVFAPSLEGCRIASANSDVKFWWGAGDSQNYFDARVRCTVILHGYKGRWYAHSIGD